MAICSSTETSTKDYCIGNKKMSWRQIRHKCTLRAKLTQKKIFRQNCNNVSRVKRACLVQMYNKQNIWQHPLKRNNSSYFLGRPQKYDKIFELFLMLLSNFNLEISSNLVRIHELFSLRIHNYVQSSINLSFSYFLPSTVIDNTENFCVTKKNTDVSKSSNRSWFQSLTR